MRFFRQTLCQSRLFLIAFLLVEIFYFCDGLRFVQAHQEHELREEQALHEFSKIFHVPLEELRPEAKAPVVLRDLGPLREQVARLWDGGTSRLRLASQSLLAQPALWSALLASQAAVASPGDPPGTDAGVAASPPDSLERAELPRTATIPASALAANPGGREVTPAPRFERVVQRAHKSGNKPGVAFDPRRMKGASTSQPTPQEPRQKSEIPASLQSIAESLGNSPADLFVYVHDNFDHDPKWGAAKPPLQTLRERKGTSWELTWLLRDLLAAAGTEAQFEWGEIEIYPDGLAQITGIEDPWRAADFLSTSGTPITLITEDGEVVSARMQHAWSLGYLDYMPNRGRQVGTPDMWVRMGPTFKRPIMWSPLRMVCLAR